MNKFYPKWHYEGTGAINQICQMYAITMDASYLGEIFEDSIYTRNLFDYPFEFGYSLLRSKATNHIIDLYNKTTVRNSGFVRYEEIMKKNNQGTYYECSLIIDPDTEKELFYSQELLSINKHTIFVLVYSNGTGRVVGNLNAGMSISLNYDSGSKKTAQERNIKYTWQSHHPSWLLNETNTIIPNGFIIARDYGGQMFSDYNTAVSYFSNKFNKDPYEFVWVNGEILFRLPLDTHTTNNLFENNGVFKFIDNIGAISKVIGLNGSFRGDISANAQLLSLKDVAIENCTNCFRYIDSITIEKTSFLGTNNDIFQNLPLLISDSSIISGSLIDSYQDITTLQINNLVKFTENSTATNSFRNLSDTAPNLSKIASIEIYGSINQCFIGSRIIGASGLLNNIGTYIQTFHVSGHNIVNSFNGNYLWTFEDISLLGRNMTNSLQNNFNVTINNIVTCNTSSTLYIAGYFNNTNNLTIKNKIGDTVGNDYISNVVVLASHTGFVGCTGSLRFKTGYNTINSGGIEGDVDAIIILAVPPFTVNYNQ